MDLLIFLNTISNYGGDGLKEAKIKKNEKFVEVIRKGKVIIKPDEKPSGDIDDFIFEEEGYKCSEK